MNLKFPLMKNDILLWDIKGFFILQPCQKCMETQAQLHIWLWQQDGLNLCCEAKTLETWLAGTKTPEEISAKCGWRMDLSPE